MLSYGGFQMFNGRRLFLHVMMGGVAALALPTRSQAQSLQYTYDVLGRVSAVAYPDGRVTTYTYDAANNRSQVTTGLPGPPPPPPSPLAVSVNQTAFGGSLDELPGPAVATATGGIPPYSYLWQYVSGDAGMPATSPTSSSTSWWSSGPAGGPGKISYWRCRVSDAANTIVYTPNVKITILMRNTGGL